MLVSGEPVAFKQTASQLVLTVPGQGDIHGDLVVALTMNQSLAGVRAISADDAGCSFAADPSTYGTVVSRNAKVFASSTSPWMPADGGASLVAEKPTNAFAIHTGQEAAPFVEIDLGKPVKVTGLFIRNADSAPPRMATMRAGVSLDGQQWTEVWQAEKAESRWEFPVTEFVSGAQIPGRLARFIRLQTHPAKPDYIELKQVEVWGK